MKCYRCGKEISDEARHCTNCGVLLKMTNKLLTAIKAGNKEAIIQFYKMFYNNVYNRFLQLGIDEQEIPGLINKAYKDFILHSHEVAAVETFEPYFYGVCDNIAFSYLKEHHQQPQELEKETFVSPNQAMIEEMLKSIGEKDEVKRKHKKKSHKSIVVFIIVLALIVAGAGGYYGFHMVNKKAVEKKRNDAYLNVNKQYVAAVHAIATDHNDSSYKKITKKYPLVSKQAYVTYYRDATANVLKNLSSKQYDLDGDGNQELLVGYKDGSDMKIIGIYKYNGKKATSLSPIKDIKHGWQYILTTHHRVLKGYKKEDETYDYELLGFKNKKLVTLQSAIDNPEKYMEDNGLMRITVQGQTIKNKKAADQKILTMQDRWVQYIEAKQYAKADQIAQRMENDVEDPCVYAMSEAMKKAYLAKIKEYQIKYDGVKKYYTSADNYFTFYTIGYLLSDLDGDGQAELMIERGAGSNNSFFLSIFTYKNGEIKLIKESELVEDCSLLYYPNHRGIIRDFGHSGYQVIHTIYIKNDQVKYKDIADIEIGENYSFKDNYITSGMKLNKHSNADEQIFYEENPKLNFDILA